VRLSLPENRAMHMPQLPAGDDRAYALTGRQQLSRGRTDAEAAIGLGDDEHADVAAHGAGALVGLQLADDDTEGLIAIAREIAQLRPLLKKIPAQMHARESGCMACNDSADCELSRRLSQCSRLPVWPCKR